MENIDLLPQWYKNNKRRQIGYRAQYFALGCIFMVLAVWSLNVKSTVSKAEAGLNKLQGRKIELEDYLRSFSKTKKRVAQLMKKVDILKKIDPKINVPSVLAELSFLIDENIVLNKVSFGAERLNGWSTGKNAASGLRTVRARNSNKEMILFGDVRFTVLISGIAADGSNVAELICKLEDSPYFCQVIPFFSRNKKTGAIDGMGDKRLKSTEFEIGCYLANYEEE